MADHGLCPDPAKRQYGPKRIKQYWSFRQPLHMIARKRSFLLWSSCMSLCKCISWWVLHPIQLRAFMQIVLMKTRVLSNCIIICKYLKDDAVTVSKRNCEHALQVADRHTKKVQKQCDLYAPHSLKVPMWSATMIQNTVISRKNLSSKHRAENEKK